MTYDQLPEYKAEQQKIVDEYQRAERTGTDINYALIENIQKKLYQIKVDYEQPQVGITSFAFDPVTIQGETPKRAGIIGIVLAAAAGTALFLIMNK